MAGTVSPDLHSAALVATDSQPIDLQILQESECSPAPSAQELMGQLHLYSTLNEVDQESLDPYS